VHLDYGLGCEAATVEDGPVWYSLVQSDQTGRALAYLPRPFISVQGWTSKTALLGSGIESRTGIGTRQQQGAGLVNSAFQGCILLLPVISKRYQHKIIVWIIPEVP
jgi:hypothetical protein